MTALADQIDAVLQRMDLGEAIARKVGRDPVWPYVPIIKYKAHTKQIMNRAFTTREAAIECAQQVIDKQREANRVMFLTPRYRAFRQQWGLPENID